MRIDCSTLITTTTWYFQIIAWWENSCLNKPPFLSCCYSAFAFISVRVVDAHQWFWSRKVTTWWLYPPLSIWHNGLPGVPNIMKRLRWKVEFRMGGDCHLITVAQDHFVIGPGMRNLQLSDFLISSCLWIAPLSA